VTWPGFAKKEINRFSLTSTDRHDTFSQSVLKRAYTNQKYPPDYCLCAFSMTLLATFNLGKKNIIALTLLLEQI
jgi:hypothetical protein